MQFGILPLHYSDCSLRTCCSRAPACAYMQFDNLRPATAAGQLPCSGAMDAWAHFEADDCISGYCISVCCISGYCSIGFLQHRVIAASGLWHIGFLHIGLLLKGQNIGFLSYRVFVQDFSGCYCISGLWHIGFLHVGFLLMLARVFVYRVIDIGFLTVGFLISGFDLEPVWWCGVWWVW
jgi:hypothetical protein